MAHCGRRCKMTNKLLQAAQAALDALDALVQIDRVAPGPMGRNAMRVLREAIEQAGQHRFLDAGNALEHHPTAFICCDQFGNVGLATKENIALRSCEPGTKAEPLYAAPQAVPAHLEEQPDGSVVDTRSEPQAVPAAWIEWDLNLNEGDPDSICAGATKPDFCADGWDWMPLYTRPAPAQPDKSEELLAKIEQLERQSMECGAGAGCCYQAARVEQLELENAELRKDAERYRFIRDADRSDCISQEISIYAMGSLDEYVDAALAGEAATKEHP